MVGKTVLFITTSVFLMTMALIMTCNQIDNDHLMTIMMTTILMRTVTMMRIMKIMILILMKRITMTRNNK